MPRPLNKLFDNAFKDEILKLQNNQIKIGRNHQAMLAIRILIQIRMI